jgi:hypothetical protein
MFAEERPALLPLPVEPFRYTATKVEATDRFPFKELRGISTAESSAFAVRAQRVRPARERCGNVWIGRTCPLPPGTLASYSVVVVICTGVSAVAFLNPERAVAGGPAAQHGPAPLPDRPATTCRRSPSGAHRPSPARRLPPGIRPRHPPVDRERASDRVAACHTPGSGSSSGFL